MNRASEFNTFGDLDISDRAADLLRRKNDTIPAYIQEKEPLMRMILWGRQILPTLTKDTSLYIVELLKGLKEYSLLRRDFTLFSFAMGRFYQDIFWGETTPHLVHSLLEFRTNEEYENYPCASEDDREALKKAIKDIVDDDMSADLLVKYYGIEDGCYYGIKDLTEIFDLGPGEIKARIRHSLLMVRRSRDKLPKIFGIENRVKARLDPRKRPYYAKCVMECRKDYDFTGEKAIALLETL